MAVQYRQNQLKPVMNQNFLCFYEKYILNDSECQADSCCSNCFSVWWQMPLVVVYLIFLDFVCPTNNKIIHVSKGSMYELDNVTRTPG
jgi:hypothetical protein